MSLSNNPNKKYYVKPVRTVPAQGYGYVPQTGQVSASAEAISPELMEIKSIGLSIFLCFITFGIYSIYWFYTLCRKIKLINGEEPYCAGEVLCFMFVPFYRLYWMYTRGKKLYYAAERLNLPIGDSSTANLLLVLFWLDLIAIALTQSSLNTVAIEVGRRNQQFLKNNE